MKSIIACILLLLTIRHAEAQGSSSANVVTTTGENTLSGAYAFPQCIVPDATTITINTSKCPTAGGGQEIFEVTPTATRNLAFPTGLVAAGGQEVEIIVNHPTTGNPGALHLLTGWQVGAGFLTNGQPVWSTDPGSKDILYCESMLSSGPTAQDGLVMVCPYGTAQNIIDVKP
jgi:hypothetical protein